MKDPLPSSRTHRLTFFEGAPESHKHVVVPNFVADEVEELRAFIKFLYPSRDQRRFALFAPDLNDLSWAVSDLPARQTYARGATPREAVKNARLRWTSESIPAILSLQS